MRVAISGGGTGGHVYPALSVAEELREGGDRILWLGRPGSLEEEIVRRAGFAYQAVAAGPLRGRAPWEMLRSCAELVSGARQSLRALREAGAQALLATGGYVSAPPVLAARMAGIPILVYLPDISPGLAVRLLSRLARQVAVSFPEVRAHFPGRRTVATGYPVRAQFRRHTREEARRRLGLPLEETVLLVMGGSQGAHSLNLALEQALPRLLGRGWMVHLSGPRDHPRLLAARQALPPATRRRYRLHDYLHEDLPLAMLAADLLVARAGAAILGELPSAGLPGLLVPYPHAGRHQLENARFLQARGAARVLSDADVRRGALPPAVEALLDDPAAMAAMARAGRRLAVPDAARRLADSLRAMAGEPLPAPGQALGRVRR